MENSDHAVDFPSKPLRKTNLAQRRNEETSRIGKPSMEEREIANGRRLNDYVLTAVLATIAGLIAKKGTAAVETPKRGDNLAVDLRQDICDALWRDFLRRIGKDRIEASASAILSFRYLRGLAEWPL